MLRTLKQFEGWKVQANDGDIGEVRSYYIDTNRWRVRYMVVEVDDHRVLLPPPALGKPGRDEKTFPVNISREKVHNSPDWSTDKPVSRQNEIDIYDYYGWSYYWVPMAVPITGVAMYPIVDMQSDVEAQRREQEGNREYDPNLYSTRELRGYRIQARDERFGHIEDFVVDDESWRVMYMIVDTGPWLFGRKVVVSPSWVSEISYDEHEARVDLEEDTIRNSPEYDPSKPIDRRYEEMLHRHYHRKGYWEESK